MSTGIHGHLRNFIQINPRVPLQRGKQYSFIAMDALQPRQRDITISNQREFTSGGSKFCNGDVLFARITPCLENGKTARVIGLKDGVGFGSTEFLVLRGIEGVSDTDFIYYLSISPEFREYARRMMTGTSGRQRVDRTALEEYALWLPSLSIQKGIVSILGSLDDKIELNRRMNETLEQMAMALYKHWFVDFGHFQDGEFVESELGMIPKGWEVVRLQGVLEFLYGKSLPEKIRIPGPFPVYGSSGEVGTHECPLIEAPGIVVGRKGTIGRVYLVYKDFYPIDTTYYLRPKEPSLTYPTTYCILNQFDFAMMNNDSAVPRLNRNDVYNLKLVKPNSSVWNAFGQEIQPLFDLMRSNEEAMVTLNQTRDYLLPRLLSGEITLDKIKEQVEEVV